MGSNPARMAQIAGATFLPRRGFRPTNLWHVSPATNDRLLITDYRFCSGLGEGRTGFCSGLGEASGVAVGWVALFGAAPGLREPGGVGLVSTGPCSFS